MISLHSISCTPLWNLSRLSCLLISWLWRLTSWPLNGITSYECYEEAVHQISILSFYDLPLLRYKRPVPHTQRLQLAICWPSNLWPLNRHLKKFLVHGATWKQCYHQEWRQYVYLFLCVFLPYLWHDHKMTQRVKIIGTLRSWVKGAYWTDAIGV